MAVNFAVVNKFTAIDRVSKVFRNMGTASEKFGNKAERSFLKASRAGSRFRDVTKGILAAGAISRGLSLVERGIAGATTEFVNFDQAITSASAKFKGLDLTTKEGIATLNKLKKAARDTGAVTQFSATQAAEGLDFLALAGFDAQQAMAALPGTVNLATVANIDLGMATDIATDSLGAFGLMTKDSIQLQKNLTRVNDVMAKTMATSNTNLEQLFESVAAGAADFTQAGQSMETFNALAGIMANAGKKGEAAGTALRNVMVRLAAPTGEAAKILDKFGVKTQDQAGNFRDVLDILDDFQKGMKGLGTAQKTAAISTVFGLRAQGAINILFKAGTKQMKEYRESLINAAGSSQKMADIMRGSILNRLKSLQSALIELAFKVFVKFEKRGGAAIEAITEAIRKFDPSMIINGIESVIKIFSRLKQEGVFDAFLLALKESIPLLGQMFRAVGKVFNFLADAGAFRAMAVGFKVLAGAIRFTTQLIKAMINIVSPLLDIVAKIASVPVSILSMAGAGAADILGAVTGGGGTTAPVAPNAKEAEAKAQQVNFQGQLDITGAPAGSTFENKGKGAPPINVAMMGAQ
jgi:TP901 family phage tail tape measure protein